MNSRIIEIIKSHFEGEVINISVKGSDSSHQRDRLLQTFSRRALNMDKNHEVFPLVSDFIKELEKCSTNTPIYNWSCFVGDCKWAGWATYEKIIYCLQSQS